MMLTFEAFVMILQMQLTVGERAHGAAYALDMPVQAGKQLRFSGATIDVADEAYVGFIDSQPVANWGHDARYVLVDRDSGKVRSVGARLPPFQADGSSRWRLVYSAPSVPPAASARPHLTTGIQQRPQASRYRGSDCYDTAHGGGIVLPKK